MRSAPFIKNQPFQKEVAAYRPPVNLEELIGDLTLHRLNQIFQDVLKRQEEKIDPIRSKFGKIEKKKSVCQKTGAGNVLI